MSTIILFENVCEILCFQGLTSFVACRLNRRVNSQILLCHTDTSKCKENETHTVSAPHSQGQNELEAGDGEGWRCSSPCEKVHFAAFAAVDNTESLCALKYRCLVLIRWIFGIDVLMLFLFRFWLH